MSGSESNQSMSPLINWKFNESEFTFIELHYRLAPLKTERRMAHYDVLRDLLYTQRVYGCSGADSPDDL